MELLLCPFPVLFDDFPCGGTREARDEVPCPVGQVDILGIELERGEIEVVFADVEGETEAIGRFAPMATDAEEVKEGGGKEAGGEDVPRRGDDEEVDVAFLRSNAEGEVVAQEDAADEGNVPQEGSVATNLGEAFP